MTIINFIKVNIFSLFFMYIINTTTFLAFFLQILQFTSVDSDLYLY